MINFNIIRSIGLGTLLAANVLLIHSNARADFKCQLEVGYKWARSNKSSDAKPVASKTSIPEPSPEAEPATVIWKQLEKSATTEEVAKSDLQKAALPERADAERVCLSQHENMSGCIAGKFASNAATINTLTFSARKAMQDAIQSDCEQQQGKCLGSTLSDAKCAEFVPAGKVVETPAAAGKDAKKKK